MTNTAYYDRFKTRVDVAEHIGVSFDNPVLWDLKSQELYLADATKESKVKDNAKQAFLAYLFFINSNDKKHSQLKKTVANDHAKGDIEAYPSSCHAALMLMNDFKPLVIKGTAPVAAQGTAFAQKKQSVTIIRNTSRTRSAITVGRKDIPRGVALRRRRHLLVRVMTSQLRATSLPNQSSL